ncbi:hypothetical protein [Liquorilactobacillus mali]|uniref:Uncharacterized protein n=1 Tax=Liquorilactobacillus mali KCTC 3596 = DSM 20444 TaxID=1046596 RepID=A0A0R2DZJ9_9LACO|nr:hypothetical protein [Liquorilactobacillus mali]KRN09361.1 hypothetical protein FD00_GL001084 [Liquorilactobacillus mali KCTC 3596 = DSM 20444]
MNESKDELFCGHTLRESYFEGLIRAKEEFEKKYHKELKTIMEDLDFNLKKGKKSVTYYKNKEDEEICDFLFGNKGLFNLFYGNVAEVTPIPEINRVYIRYVPRKSVEAEVRNNLN